MLELCRLITLVTLAVMNSAITSTLAQAYNSTTCSTLSDRCTCAGSDLTCADLGELDEIPDDVRNALFSRLSITGRSKIWSIQAEAFSVSTHVVALTLVNIGVKSVDSKAFGNTFGNISSSLYSIDLHGNSIQRIDDGTFYDVVSDSLSIDLSSNEISFLASGSVFGDYVTELDLSGNRLRDIDPSTFRLPNLRILTIASNLLTSLPADVFNVCRSLTTLSLANNRLSNFESLGFLSELTYLDLGNNRLSFIPSTAILKLTALVYLNVRGNHISQADWLTPSDYGPSPPIERLLLDRNKIRDLAHVHIAETDPIMTSFSLAANRITEIPSRYFFSNVHLNNLNLSINNITNINSNSLSNLVSLTFLNLSHNSIANIDSSALGDLIALVTLDLSHNKLETLDSEVFANCTQLKELFLADNRLKYLPAGLFRSNRYLLKIDLSQNRLTTVPDDMFSTLSNLNSLILSNNYLSSIAAEAFASLFGLETIDLSDNYLTDDVYVNLYGLFNLSSFAIPSTRLVVNLKNNRLTNLALSSLSIFDWYPCISQLQLKGNSITAISSLNLRTNYTALSCLGSGLNIDLSSNSIRTIESFAFNGSLAQYVYSLNLSRNSLTSINDKMFAGLRNLQTLDLSWNRLSALPEKCFSNLASLFSLFLNGNLLASISPEAFIGPDHIYALDLSNNQLGDGVYSVLFSRSWYLQDLKLDGNGISYFDALLFARIDVSNCSMRNNTISKVANLTECYRSSFQSGLRLWQLLDLGQNQIGADFDLVGFLQCLSNLRTLKLDGNDIGTGRYDLSSLTFDSLSSVDLSYNVLTSTDLAELSALFPSTLLSLSLDGNKLDNLSIAILTASSSLTYLSVRDNNLSSDALATIAKFVNLQTLHLDGNRIETIPNSTFRWLQDLTDLSIGRNQLTKVFQLAFDGLEQSCYSLDLADNQIDFVDPGAITRLRNIAFLGLESNIIKRLSLPPIMDSLQVLKLNNNYLSHFPEGPLQFRSIRNLDVSKNQIATLPSDLEIYNDAEFYVQAVKLSDNMLDNVDTMALIGSFGCVDVSNNVIQNIYANGSLVGDQTVYIDDLDLSGNQLVEISDVVGKGLASAVRQLDISNNNLMSLNWSLPPSDSNVLEELLLSGNQIAFVGAQLMQQLAEPLLTLDLQDNSLKRLDQTAFNVTSGTSSNGDRPSLLLSGNPWICDCSLEWLRYGWTGAAVDNATCWTPMSKAGQYIVCYSPPSNYSCSTDSANSVGTSENVVDLCTEYANQVNAYRPSATDVQPLYGPVAGGTRITISGQLLDNKKSVAVMFPSDDSAYDIIKLVPSNSSAGNTALELITPAVDESSPADAITNLQIVVVFDGGPTLYTSKNFSYRPNPNISSIYPLQHLLSGGTTVTFSGTNLDSSASPMTLLTVVVTRYTVVEPSANDLSRNVLADVLANVTFKATTTTNTATDICEDIAFKSLTCRMPAVPLPSDFIPELNGTVNASSLQVAAAGYSAGCLTSRSNGRDIACVTAGITFDNYRHFENLTMALPDVRITYYMPPLISARLSVLEFDPRQETTIDIYGQHLDVGIDLKGYVISIGSARCVGKNLFSNKLQCQPPPVQPPLNASLRSSCDQLNPIFVRAGYSGPFFYTCIRYTSNDVNVGLIVGLTVGLGVPFIIVIIVLVACLVYRRRKRTVNAKAKTLSPTAPIKSDYDRQLPVGAEIPRQDSKKYSAYLPKNELTLTEDYGRQSQNGRFDVNLGQCENAWDDKTYVEEKFSSQQPHFKENYLELIDYCDGAESSSNIEQKVNDVAKEESKCDASSVNASSYRSSEETTNVDDVRELLSETTYIVLRNDNHVDIQ